MRENTKLRRQLQAQVGRMGGWVPIHRHEYIGPWLDAYEHALNRRWLSKFSATPQQAANIERFAFRFPGDKNVHIDRELTGFAVDFARDRNTQATEIISPAVTVPNLSDKYYRFDEPSSFRITDDELDAYAPGEAGGEPKESPMKFDIASFECVHRALMHNLGEDMEGNADFNLRSKFIQHLTAQLQTFKLNRALDLATTAANMNNDSATNLGGGQWDQSSKTLKYIQKTIHAVARTVAKNSFNTVMPGNFWMVINPNTAANIGQNEEVLEFVRANPAGPQALVGADPFSGITVGGQYNIPRNLFGVNVLVLEHVKRTSEEGASSDTDAYIMPDDKALFVHTDNPSIASFSTLTTFEFAPFNVQAFSVPHEHRTSLQVHNTYAVKITAKNSGYLVTDVLSASASII